MVRGFKIYVVLAALLVTLGLFLYGGDYIFSRRVKEPLVDTLLTHPEVREIAVEERGGSLFLAVELEGVENIQRTYRHLQDVAARNTDGEFTIRIVDSRNDFLQQAYNDVHYGLYEARLTGRYTELEDYLSDKLSDHDALDYGVFVDEKAIYVQLTNEEHTLYQVIDLNEESD